MNLNEIAKANYETARKRQENGANISVETRAMLKHCATEVVEAMEAYTRMDSYPQLNKPEQEIFKDHFASELADIICCCAIIACEENIDLDKTIADCLDKNRKRAEGIGDKL
mgnify:FL=1